MPDGDGTAADFAAPASVFAEEPLSLLSEAEPELPFPPDVSVAGLFFA